MPRYLQFERELPEIPVPRLEAPTIIKRYPLDGNDAGHSYDSNVVIGFPEGGNIEVTEYHEADGSVRYVGVSPRFIVGLSELINKE